MMNRTLDYRGRPLDGGIGSRDLPVAVRASFGFALAGVGLAILSLTVLGERLVWEGGQQAYVVHFPFVAVWVLCAWGALCAIGSCVRRHGRAAAVAGLIVNLIVGGFFVRSYVRASQDVQTADNSVPR